MNILVYVCVLIKRSTTLTKTRSAPINVFSQTKRNVEWGTINGEENLKSSVFVISALPPVLPPVYIFPPYIFSDSHFTLYDMNKYPIFCTRIINNLCDITMHFAILYEQRHIICITIYTNLIQKKRAPCDIYIYICNI